MYRSTLLLLALVSAMSCGTDDGDAAFEPDAGLVDEADAGPAYDFSAVDERFIADDDKYLGYVYVSVYRGDQRIYEYSSGGATEDSVFDLASATKWIAGGVILSLIDDGAFGIDDPVGSHLQVMADNGKGDFTVRHGFSMSSGLFDESRPHTNSKLTLEQSVAAIAANTAVLFTPPGSQIAYDGKQMQVVGRVAEVATGKDWRTLAREQLFDKCGMTSSNFDVFGTNPAVAGGLSTSPADYLAYMKMVMNGGTCGDSRVLSESSIAEMFTNQTNDAPVAQTYWESNHPDYPYGKDDLRYSFGAWILAENPETGDVEEITSPGAWGTFPWVDRKRGIHGIIATYIPLPDGGFRRVLDSELAILSLIRSEIDRVDN